MAICYWCERHLSRFPTPDFRPDESAKWITAAAELALAAKSKLNCGAKVPGKALRKTKFGNSAAARSLPILSPLDSCIFHGMTNAPRSNRSAARAPQEQERLQWMTRRNGLIPAKKGTTYDCSLSKGRGRGGDGAEAADKDWICLTASSPLL